MSVFSVEVMWITELVSNTCRFRFRYSQQFVTELFTLVSRISVVFFNLGYEVQTDVSVILISEDETMLVII